MIEKWLNNVEAEYYLIKVYDALQVTCIISQLSDVCVMCLLYLPWIKWLLLSDKKIWKILPYCFQESDSGIFRRPAHCSTCCWQMITSCLCSILSQRHLRRMSSLSSYNHVWKHLSLPDMCSIDSFKNYLQPNTIGKFEQIYEFNSLWFSILYTNHEFIICQNRWTLKSKHF